MYKSLYSIHSSFQLSYALEPKKCYRNSILRKIPDNVLYYCFTKQESKSTIDLWGTGLGYHLPILNPGSTVHTKLFIGSVAWLGGDLQYTNFILVVTVPTQQKILLLALNRREMSFYQTNRQKKFSMIVEYLFTFVLFIF